MRKKIYTRLLLTGIISIILTAIVTVFVYYNMFKKQIVKMVFSTAAILADSYNFANGDIDFSDFDNIDGRITLVDSDGRVLYDNVAEASEMDNHLNRPEIEQAINDGIGKSVHSSSTLGEDYHYCAIKLEDGKVLRYSKSADSVFSIFLNTIPVQIVITIILFLLCLIYAKYLANQVIKPINNMSVKLDSDELIPPYDEFVPFVRAIKERNDRIAREIENLQLEKNKIEAVMENMSEGMVLLDERITVMSVNASSIALLNGNENSIGKNLLFFTRNDTVNRVARLALFGAKVSEEINVQGKWLSVISSPVFNGDMIIGVILLIVDITEKREVEKMRSEFTANVSHELKTPLTSITGYSEIIESGMANDIDTKRFAGKIHSEALRLLTLIGDIIKISELEEIKDPSDYDEINLLDIVNYAFDVSRIIAENKNVELKVDVIGNPIIYADSSLVELIVNNLCDNAIRYNKQGGKVIVSVGDNVLSVRDTGIGIPDKHKARIFERFYRVDKSRSKETGGTGLGLSIVKHAAKRLQAKIILDSKEDVGTEIKIIFKDISK